jgi:hypothetical protein
MRILSEIALPVGIMIAGIAVPILLGLWMYWSISDINKDLAEKASAAQGATVARICRDGSYIYHYSDGTYRTNLGYRIDDVNTVCDH